MLPHAGYVLLMLIDASSVLLNFGKDESTGKIWISYGNAGHNIIVAANYRNILRRVCTHIVWNWICSCANAYVN